MPDSFKKQKLSRKALDEFALKYSYETPEPHTMPYTLANGKKVFFKPVDAITNRMARISLFSWSNFSLSR